MMNVKVDDVCRLLEIIAPLTLAESWDNVGLLLGSRSADVRAVMTCLTLTPDVAQEAMDRGVQLIVTHHPILFRGTKRLTDESSEGAMLLNLARAGIAVYSAHTAFDSAAGGINESLAVQLGLTDIRPLRPHSDTARVGAGRVGRLPAAIPRDALLRQLARVVNAAHIEMTIAGPVTVQTIGIACGSAGDFLPDAARERCDTFITGEARFHTALEASSRGMNLILTGHYASERPAMVALASQLAHKLSGITVFASALDSDPLSRWVG